MKKIFCIFMMCISSQVYALEIAGVKLQDQILIDGHPMVLNGAGIRTKFFFKVYVAALYLPERKNTVEAILADAGPKRIALYMLRDVSGKKMLEAINEAMPANLNADEIKMLAGRLDEFSKMFSAVSEVKKGDVLTFDYVPATGTRVTIAGVDKGHIDGADFNRALLKVWIGDKPVQADLKQDILGKE
jgi:hypothetical protein